MLVWYGALQSGARQLNSAREVGGEGIMTAVSVGPKAKEVVASANRPGIAEQTMVSAVDPLLQYCHYRPTVSSN